MEDLYFNNEIKAIGVSNFEIIHLENILRICKIKPMVNQIEMHPGLNNTKLIKFCKKHNILVQAYAPLVHGKAGENPLLQKLAKKYNKSIAQICIR
jgi:diketogulonate reductase-like aldo/keto reductase